MSKQKGWIPIFAILILCICICSCGFRISFMSTERKKLKMVLSKYKEDTTWTKRLNVPFIIYSKIEGEENYVKEVPDTEASSYLHHIIQNYDNLDEWTLFVHAHETHWHHPTSILQSAKIDLEKMEEKNIKFFSVNHNNTSSKPILMNVDFQRGQIQPSELTLNEFQIVFKDLFGGDEYKKACDACDGGIISKQQYPATAQFFVHRSRILNRPKSFYARCLAHLQHHPLLSRRATNDKHSRMVGGFYLETLWHYIFGEELLYTPPIKNYEDYPFHEE